MNKYTHNVDDKIGEINERFNNIANRNRELHALYHKPLHIVQDNAIINIPSRAIHTRNSLDPFQRHNETLLHPHPQQQSFHEFHLPVYQPNKQKISKDIYNQRLQKLQQFSSTSIIHPMYNIYNRKKANEVVDRTIPIASRSLDI